MDNLIYYVHIGGQQSGPYELNQLHELGITGETMVWRSDLPSWVKAETLPELLEIISPPQPTVIPNPEPPYQQPYSQPPYAPQSLQTLGYLPLGWTNWAGWAIAGIVVGALSCCIGWIFGVIGLVKATEANTYAKCGMISEADRANSTAKTWTIISLILGAITLLAVVIYYMVAGVFITALFDSLY